ncbi:MAG: laccase domain-containing protein, partial [Clostridia bacterium]
VHAGWRGTASKTVSCAVEKMHMEFGCTPQDILAGIGPAAGLCCYETNEDVPHAMEQSFGTTAQKHMEACGEKWHVDMAGLNREALLGCGVLPQNITESGECTCCKDDIYWSHRKTDGIRGCMAAIIMLY